MDLSASDIRNRSFSQSLRGLEAEDVYTFLDEVADQWDEMVRHTQELEERVETLETKLNEIGETAKKAKTTKERAEALQEKMRDKKQRLDKKERDLNEARGRLETKQAKLRSIAQRLQETLQEETRALSSLASSNGNAPLEETGSDSSRPADGTNESPASSDDERSTEEWVDSLFPNRLPKNEPAPSASPDASTDAEEGDLSASESQFQAIKQDVQEMDRDGLESSPSSNDGKKEESPPPTEEINQIWDVFDDQDSA